MSNAFNLNQAIRAVVGDTAIAHDIFTGTRNRPFTVPLGSWQPGWALKLAYSSLSNLEIGLMHHGKCVLQLGYNLRLRRMGLGNERFNPIPFNWFYTHEEFMDAASTKLGDDTMAMHILQQLLEHTHEKELACIP